jgi:stage IV sporulation protein B
VKKFFRAFAAACGIASFILLGTAAGISARVPDEFSVNEGSLLSFSNGIPVTACPVGFHPAEADAAPGQCAGQGKYLCDLRLFGAVEVKQVSVCVTKPQYVCVGGQIFGIKLYADGVMVIGMSDVDTPSGPKDPALDAGIRKGDVIISVGGQRVTTNEEIGKIFMSSSGAPLDVSFKRGDTGCSATVRPAFSRSAGTYKAGMWVRDSTAGIGTVTYYDPSSGVFAGLGHAVCDVDTGALLPLSSGQAVGAQLFGVTRGGRGRTGALEGTLGDTPLGSLVMNTPTGIYGVLCRADARRPVEIAKRQQVKKGPAKLICTVDGAGIREYSVNIDSVNYDAAAPTKNMVVRVTDEKLISKTGGIVQGMSGSPLIQGGRLIGAVTHVFVSDPMRGYGIFAENMQKTAETLENARKSGVS